VRLDACPPLSPPDGEIDALDPESYEAAVMAGDSAASEWLHGAFDPEDDRPSAAVLEEKLGEGGTEDDDDAGWLPLLTPEDRSLVRDYMHARNFPRSAVESLGKWPTGELRHLLANARIWKVAEAQRAADRAESAQLLKELGQRRAENRAVLERISRDQATALLARDADKSLILLSAREARRCPSGNHIDGNPGVDLERHLRQVASERGFATGPAHWDRASKRLLIDLFHLDAEAWWNSGRARGLVLIPPNSNVLESKRTYRALYPDVDPASIVNATRAGANEEDDEEALAAAYEALAEDRRRQEMERTVASAARSSERLPAQEAAAVADNVPDSAEPMVDAPGQGPGALRLTCRRQRSI
jgi:hypothetical protein